MYLQFKAVALLLVTVHYLNGIEASWEFSDINKIKCQKHCVICSVATGNDQETVNEKVETFLKKKKMGLDTTKSLNDRKTVK